ncbi:MAG: hypothetical protein FJ279_05320, partial [Planctomycetes bacterium]|nr:hypothetical protein [Planctomycetota bacterium]
MRALLAGASETAVTPPIGAPLVGPTASSTGVHDELFARALVLSDGRQRAAIVCLDLVGLDFTLVDEIRDQVRQRAGITTTLLNCTHTHSAPFTVPWSVLGWRWLAGDGLPWRAELVTKVTETVCKAAESLSEAVLRVGRATAQVGVNRRLPTPQGVTMKPNAQGAVVPWVDVLRVDAADETPKAILFSHAAHPVIVHGASTLISADYPGYAAARVKQRLGGETMALFAQGCGANINGEPLRGGFEAAERAGVMLADAAVKAAVESQPLKTARLAAKSVTLALPFRDGPSPDEAERALREAEDRLAQAKSKVADERQLWYSLDTVLCLQDLSRRAGRGERPSLRFEVNALTVGNEWCLLTMPHEVFAEYQLWADQVSPIPRTMTLAYTNGCESYIPTDEAFQSGGYEAASFPSVAAALRYRNRIA